MSEVVKGKLRYFELFSHSEWSLNHFYLWVQENHDATEEVNARKFFYNIVNAISNDSEASQEVQEVAKKLLKRKKLECEDCMITGANKRILGDVTNLIPVPVAGEKRKNYDANIIDISSKRMKVPVNSVTTFEASSNMQYLSP
ncbi:12988_t:CDS:2, partial [Dentiscutata erythropus]